MTAGHEDLPAGHARPRRRRAPFASLRPYAVAAGLYAAAAGVWAAAGTHLPGGRWTAVHLLTLGVITNVISAFTRHFGATLTRQPETWPWWLFWGLNGGVLAVLVGMLLPATALVALGGTVVAGIVVVNWWDLRRKRRRALGARFAWVVRTYERAHGAFVHGAVLGVLLGTGVLGGAWYGPARLAHLHVNILGWGGLTLMATLVFFGPTVLRVRIENGADARAPRWLRVAATALTVAALALLASGFSGAVGTAMRLVAAVSLGVYGAATLAICLPVLRVARTARPSFSGNMLQAACVWLPLAVGADAVVVATGEWRLLDAVGVALLLGVLAQSIIGALGYVAPMFTAAEPRSRARMRQSVERGPILRAAVLNMGVGLLVITVALGPAAGQLGAVVLRLGAAVVAASMLGHLAAVLVRRRSAQGSGLVAP